MTCMLNKKPIFKVANNSFNVTAHPAKYLLGKPQKELDRFFAQKIAILQVALKFRVKAGYDPGRETKALIRKVFKKTQGRTD